MTEKCSDAQYLAIAENYKRISERVAEAAVRSGRQPEDIKLLAATKTVPPEAINHAIRCGLRLIGENRVQELTDKYDRLTLSGVDVHMIGHLQTNKVKYIADKVACIQSLDSLRLAEEISKHALRLNRRIPVLVEVNIGGEANKGGVAPDTIRAFLHEISGFEGILVDGLMAIPPICSEKKALCNYFSRMQRYFIDIRDEKIDNVFMHSLSMGMSSDFEEAILCGATMVRVGSALFGQRNYT